MRHKEKFFLAGSACLIIILFITMPIYAADTKEKPLIIKGLQIGMSGAAAKAVLDRVLNKDWSASNVDIRDRLLIDYKPDFNGDAEVFGKEYTIPDIGTKGILIKSNTGYHGGYISIDESDNTVTQITFGGRLSNDLFNASTIKSDDFMRAFEKYYNMPEFNWVPGGWRYESPNNYVIQITTQKKIDIKKEIITPRPVINFN
jgi:hypothetical protein